LICIDNINIIIIIKDIAVVTVNSDVSVTRGKVHTATGVVG